MDGWRVKRDRGSEKGPPTYTHTQHTHAHPTGSELSPATWRPRILKKNFFFQAARRQGRDDLQRLYECVYNVQARQPKIKIKKNKRGGKKAGRKTGESPMTRRANSSFTSREHQAGAGTVRVIRKENIKEHQSQNSHRTSLRQNSHRTSLRQENIKAHQLEK